jgi:copper homeostasis protein
LASQSIRVAPAEPITILPGSGIGPNTVQILVAILLRVGLKEIHLSAGNFVESEMQYRKRAGREDLDATGMGMGEWKVWQTDEHVVRQMRAIIDRAVAASPNSAGLGGLSQGDY